MIPFHGLFPLFLSSHSHQLQSSKTKSNELTISVCSSFSLFSSLPLQVSPPPHTLRTQPVVASPAIQASDYRTPQVTLIWPHYTPTWRRRPVLAVQLPRPPLPPVDITTILTILIPPVITPPRPRLRPSTIRHRLRPRQQLQPPPPFTTIIILCCPRAIPCITTTTTIIRLNTWASSRTTPRGDTCELVRRRHEVAVEQALSKRGLTELPTPLPPLSTERTPSNDTRGSWWRATCPHWPGIFGAAAVILIVATVLLVVKIVVVLAERRITGVWEMFEMRCFSWEVAYEIERIPSAKNANFFLLCMFKL